MRKDETNPEFIIDANVLIDYCKADLSILTIFSKAIGTINIPTPIIYDEVSQISITKAEKFFLNPVEPTLEQLIEAKTIKRTHFCDNLCFLIAQHNGYTCVTNDKPLKRLCKKHNVPSIWGLEILVILANKSKITKRKAVNVAYAIQKSNPFITNEIIQRFKNKIHY
tara:strand:- start:244 stop:744 length:501 start_codon:yes stop_codon:yes gene_type:complete